MNPEQLLIFVKDKNKKVRHTALENITLFSRSNNVKWKKSFLELILLKSNSSDWEERYVAMYALSRFMTKNWDFEDFKKQFLNTLRLLEDSDGRVRIAARTSLEHLRMSFLLFIFGQWKTDGKELVELWKNALFETWKKIEDLGEGKMQAHLLQCSKILYQHDMDAYLNKEDFKKYEHIGNNIRALDDFYYGFEEGE